MLTYPIKMMFWKIVQRMQVRARVTAWAVGLRPLQRDREACPCPVSPQPPCQLGTPTPCWGGRIRGTEAQLCVSHHALTESFLSKDSTENSFS